jgi:hypothetical protein
MAQPTVKDLGAFAAGEVPPPLVVSFQDFEKNPVNLTGFTNIAMNIEEELGVGEGTLGLGTVQVTDAPGGVFEYTWVRADMITVGEYTAQGWVDNATSFYASDLYTYTVYDGPGDPPA